MSYATMRGAYDEQRAEGTSALYGTVRESGGDVTAIVPLLHGIISQSWIITITIYTPFRTIMPRS